MLFVLLVPALCGGPCTPTPYDPSPGEFWVGVFGDSLATGFGAAPGYVEKLPEAWNVESRAFAGQCGGPLGAGILACDPLDPSGRKVRGAALMEDALLDLLADPGIDVAVAMWGTNDVTVGSILNWGGQLDHWRTNSRDVYIADLLSAIDLAHQIQIDVVYVFPPINTSDSPDGELRNQLLEEIRALLIEPLAERGVPTVDLYAASQLDPSMIGGDSLHFSEDGAVAAAGLIAAAVEAFE
jgi:lysophospholipase L1-like esterase